MPVKHIISPGIGFSPGKVHYIVTRGLSIGEAAAVTLPGRQTAHLLSSARQSAYLASASRQTAFLKSSARQTAKVDTP